LVVAELTGPPPARGSPRASEKRVTADGRSQRSSLATLSAMTFTTKLGSPSAAARTYASVKTRPRSVLDPTRDSIRTAYFWLYLGDGDHGYIVYDYRDSRCRGGPAEMLMDFPGYLQTDAYASDESAVEESGGRAAPIACRGWLGGPYDIEAFKARKHARPEAPRDPAARVWFRQSPPGWQ
jgi:hypothetical protein